MLKSLRRHLGTIAVAMVTAAVTAAAPAIAHGVEHALFAHDADKVDGKHAVGSGATLTNRKGKLVATNGTTGLLPNNIIAKAPDADKLDGQDSSAFLGASAKAADANLLDGIDSTGFIRGNGKVMRGAIALSSDPGFYHFFGNWADDPAPSPWIGVAYHCPADLARTNGDVLITNYGNETVNVFSDNGGTNPNNYTQLGEDGAYQQPAAASGEHITFQVQGNGMATVEVFSVHRTSDNKCHAQAEGVFSHP
jgi:hypothetical protein